MKRIFISYRKSDSQSATDHLHTFLTKALSKEIVFRDVDGIYPGEDWRKTLDAEIATCDVMLVMIGRQWLTVRDERGNRRIDDPDDVVRYEVQRGLQRSGITVIAVTVEGAELPQEAALPQDLRGLLRRQAAPLRPGRDFEPDARLLMRSIDRNYALRRLQRRAVVLLPAAIGAVGVVGLFAGWWRNELLAGAAGERLFDRFVEVRVPESVSGTMLADEPYELSLECRNATSMSMNITKIIVESRNEDVARLFGHESSLVFTAENHVPRFLKPHESIDVELRLNQILPRLLEIAVFHNQSAEPSRFSVDLKAEALPMPAARFLARSQIFQGVNGREAVDRAWRKAREWSEDAQLLAAFPGNSSTYVDAESRLKYRTIEQWVVTFQSAQKHSAFMTMVTADGASGNEVPRDEEVGEKLLANEVPQFGDQESLDLANRAGLLRADWGDGTRLSVFPVGGKPSAGWILSYRGPEGMPIIVDASTGEQLKPAGKGEFRREPITSAAATSP